MAFFYKSEAQQSFFKNYSVESGLPFVQVSCTFQDKQGYLWSGGYGGLSRFDGKIFLNFNRKNGLNDHNVNVICSDDSGRIFIGTNKGLSVLHGRKFTNYDRSQGLSNIIVTSLCKGKGNIIYIGTRGGLFIYSNNKISLLEKSVNYKINYIYHEDPGTLFIGTDEGLILYRDQKFMVPDNAPGIAKGKINCIAKFRNYLAIGTSQGLSLYDQATKKFTSYFVKDGLIDENISALNNQNDLYLWIGAQRGLMRFDGNDFEYFRISSENNSNFIRCILNDREDNIWLGTHSGLFRYRDNSFTTFDNVPGLRSSFVFQIFRDKKEDLWVCAQENGIYRGQKTGFKQYTSSNGLKYGNCKAGKQDNEGRLLFGTIGDLARFRNEKFESITLPESFKGSFEELYVTADNTLWIGGTNGIASLIWKNDKPEIKFYPIRTKSEFNVYGFCEDDNKNLYIGTYHEGLFRMSNGKIENLSRALNLDEETFFTLRYVNHHIFAASLNGLLILDLKTNTLKRITDLDGLNSELIYSIEFTENKNALWIGTNQGINRLDLKKYFSENKIEIRSFGKQEGFAGVECNTNGIWEDKDGTLWFGTVSGLIKYQPSFFKKNLVENKTIIQNIRLLNEDTVLRNNCSLPSNYNTVSFYYRGICLSNPDKVLYRKRLEGLPAEKDWSVPGNEDYIKYTNLAPGKYSFKVRSCNNEGIWNSEETTFSFQIKPPFYLTWWFILAGSIVSFSIVYFTFRMRIINIKKKQKAEFERKVEMSKIELKALRSQMNPHFIFNSLNAIQHYIFNAKSEEAAKYLNKFARLVRTILNNSEKPFVTVGEDIEALRLYLELEQMRFEEKFDYEIVIDGSVDPDYDAVPPLLMQPYVENAVLHGLNPKPIKGKLKVLLSSKNNFLICTIIDNGIGREKASEIRKTMPFKNKSFGMKITEDRLRILNEINNSELSVTITDLMDENQEACGTKVELFVPLTG